VPGVQVLVFTLAMLGGMASGCPSGARRTRTRVACLASAFLQAVSGETMPLPSQHEHQHHHLLIHRRTAPKTAEIASFAPVL
jgi:hypothetical protein